MANTDGHGLKWAAGIDSTATFFIDFFVDIFFFLSYSATFSPDYCVYYCNVGIV